VLCVSVLMALLEMTARAPVCIAQLSTASLLFQPYIRVVCTGLDADRIHAG